MSTTKYPDPTAMKGLLLFALQSPSVRKITSTRMTATAAKMDLVVDPFCARQFAESGEASRRYGGTVFTTSISAFEDIVNARYDESHLKDGYAPFCKHLFIENDFTDAKVNVLEISEMNQDKLRSKYEARNEKELPVLTRWFPRELVGDELPVAKYLDIWMEARRGHFYPFTYSARRKSVPAFYEIFERVRFRDQECALSLKRRRRLLNIFDFRESASLDEVTRANEQKEDVSHLLPYATSITKRLRFFGPGSGTANQELAEMTRKMILLSSAGTDISRLSIDAEASFGSKGEGTWFLINHDRHTLSIVHFSSQNKSQVSERTHNEGLDDIYRELVFHTVSVFDLYQLKDDFEEGGGEEEDVEEFAEHLGVSEIADT